MFVKLGKLFSVCMTWIGDFLIFSLTLSVDFGYYKGIDFQVLSLISDPISGLCPECWICRNL